MRGDDVKNEPVPGIPAVRLHDKKRCVLSDPLMVCSSGECRIVAWRADNDKDRDCVSIEYRSGDILKLKIFASKKDFDGFAAKYAGKIMSDDMDIRSLKAAPVSSYAVSDMRAFDKASYALRMERVAKKYAKNRRKKS